MRVNKIVWDRLNSQWEILKTSAAYIHAEQRIVNEAAKGNDITGADSMSAKQHFEFDAFGEPLKRKTEIELLDEQMTALEQYGAELLEREDYRKLAEVKKTYEKLIMRWKQINKQ